MIVDKTAYFRREWLPKHPTCEIVLKNLHSKYTPVTYRFYAADGTGTPFYAQGGPFWDAAAHDELLHLATEHNRRVREAKFGQLHDGPASRGPCQLHDRETAKAEEASSSGLKDTNPKDAIGSTKVPLSLVPLSALIEAALCMANGKGKYGQVNWRQAGVRASVYVDALLRHAELWNEGEERDEENAHNLGAIIACAAILLEAQALGNLVDDRPMSMPNARKLLDKGAANLRVILERNAGKSPKHYTIQDTWTAGEPAAQVPLKVERIPFDLARALAGHPLVTRDGRPAEGFNERWPSTGYAFKYAAWVRGSVLITVDEEGRSRSGYVLHNDDLFMAT